MLHLAKTLRCPCSKHALLFNLSKPHTLGVSAKEDFFARSTNILEAVVRLG
jgi:hypothetical protein